MKTIKKYITVLSLFVSASAAAQDYHMSQYETAPMYLNPALTGMYFGEKGDYKASANYRSQWKSIVPKPYVTASLAYDMPYQRFGMGAYLINNKAGTGGFSTLNFMLSGAYRITKDPQNIHNLTAGLQLGILYKSFNFSKFTFDNQYDPSSGFDQGLSSGENFDKTGIVRLDAGIGVFYRYMDESKKVSPFGGVSLFHLNKPNESFTSFESRLPMRLTIHGGSDVKVNEKLKIVPGVLIMTQAKGFELGINTIGYYKIKDTDYDAIFGLGYRHKDAIVIHIGMKQKNNIVRFSYDVNTSYLNNFSGGRGGFELSLIYTGYKKVKTHGQF